MPDQVSVGEYSLEVSGDEVLVRDESGAIVESVDLDELDGEITLPDGQKIDLASVLAERGIENFETAAGPANDNAGATNSGSAAFRPFTGTNDPANHSGPAGALDGTSLTYGLIEGEPDAEAAPDTLLARTSFDWSRHDAPASGRSGSDGNSGNHQNQPGGNQSSGNDDDGEDVTPPFDELQPPLGNGNISHPDEKGEEPVTPPTDEQQSKDEQQDKEQQPQLVNAAPTDIDLAGASVVENASGAIVGSLTVVDPDDDTHSFAVSDDRFEVVNGQLKLKDGISLDFEETSSLDVMVTATDTAGNQLAETFTITAIDANEPQTALSLGNDHVSENTAGALVGTIFVADPDAGDTQSLQVSDSRFEIVEDVLRLKEGVALDSESEPSVLVTIAATDVAGHVIHQDFTIDVDDINEAPVVTAEEDAPSSYELYTSQLGKGQTTVGAGDDLLHIDTKSFSPVRMGDGDDTVHLAQNNRSFDHQDAIKLESVETIDATGYGANNVSLSIHDVLNMTDGDNRLTIMGEQGDTVTLTGSGTDQWNVVESNNAGFTTYAWNDGTHQAVVEISNQLNTQVS